MEDPDPQIVRAAAAGDTAAFAEVVRQVQAHVWRFLVHLTGDRDLAADLTQDTLLKAHRSLDSFRHQSKFSTWLFRIARNTVTDHQRAMGRQRRLATEAAQVSTSSTPDPSRAHEVTAAIEDLTPALREVFVLVEVFGLRYREAATVLDLPEGTIKSRMYHARKALVAWFEADDDQTIGGAADGN